MGLLVAKQWPGKVRRLIDYESRLERQRKNTKAKRDKLITEGKCGDCETLLCEGDGRYCQSCDEERARLQRERHERNKLKPPYD